MMLESENQRIKIFSKRLPSGNCQVKFYVSNDKGHSYYGYMLVASGKKVSDVITLLHAKIRKMDSPDNYYHGHLFDLGKKQEFDPGFILYRQ